MLMRLLPTSTIPYFPSPSSLLPSSPPPFPPPPPFPYAHPLPFPPLLPPFLALPLLLLYFFQFISYLVKLEGCMLQCLCDYSLVGY